MDDGGHLNVIRSRILSTKSHREAHRRSILKSTASGERGQDCVGSVAFGDDRMACPVFKFSGPNTGQFKRDQQMEYVCGLLLQRDVRYTGHEPRKHAVDWRHSR
jgi:hypothetical protein